MSSHRIGLAAGATVLAGGLLLGGSALANAVSGTTSTTASSSTNGDARGGYGGSADTPVTGDEAAKVTAAVKAKDSSVTVTSVRKDPDGSYDVLGTKSGSQVMYDVSKDLKTITARTFDGGHGGEAPSTSGGPSDSPSDSAAT